MNLTSGTPGQPGFRVGGFPVMSFRVLCADQPKGIPEPYLDLGISSAAKYEWGCQLIADKLGLFFMTVGDDRESAERTMLEQHGELVQSKVNAFKS